MTPDWEPQDDNERAVIAEMIKVAAEYSLEDEVMWEYKAHREKGRYPEDAAAFALYEWDL